MRGYGEVLASGSDAPAVEVH